MPPLATRLHPPFLHFPIASWTAGTGLDLALAAGLGLPGPDGHALAHGLLWAGVLSALPTAAAGLVDFARLPRSVQDSRFLKRHMLAMSVAFLLYFAAAAWRLEAGAFAAPAAPAMLLLEAAGLAALVAGGHWGGRVVFDELPRADPPGP
ncbi:MAG TPA: DUF2231 domain-containing protein [Woeseiaceae bacterium]|nr:DUF2231 domain-containing protein [Woeseiaceae bacterium]